MEAVVVYKTKYGATRTYANWIADELNCPVIDAKATSADELSKYDTVIYGGGLYAEVINGVSLITKNAEKLKDARLFVFTTGLTPARWREYYEKMVFEKNFKGEIRDRIKMYNFPGKMINSELSLVHRTALKTLKKIMSEKKNPTEMERLLVELCDADGDFSDRAAIKPLIEDVLKE